MTDVILFIRGQVQTLRAAVGAGKASSSCQRYMIGIKDEIRIIAVSHPMEENQP